jgi:hypothetical protein
MRKSEQDGIRRMCLLMFASAAILSTSGVQGQTTHCTQINPSGTPITIDTPGVHCLTGDLVMPSSFTSGYAIWIITDNVVLDLNDHHVNGLAANIDATQAFGIGAPGRKNIQIKNGRVSGFQYGVVISGGDASSGSLVENIVAYKNKFGINVSQSPGAIVRNNNVVASGLGLTSCGTSYAISLSESDGGKVLNNNINDTGSSCPSAAATGINVGGWGSSAGIVVAGNRIRGTSSQPGPHAGIRISGPARVLAEDNTIASVGRGISFEGSSTGKYRNNLTFDVTLPYSGGIDAGNNQ